MLIASAYRSMHSLSSVSAAQEWLGTHAGSVNQTLTFRVVIACCRCHTHKKRAKKPELCKSRSRRFRSRRQRSRVEAPFSHGSNRTSFTFNPLGPVRASSSRGPNNLWRHAWRRPSGGGCSRRGGRVSDSQGSQSNHVRSSSGNAPTPGNSRQSRSHQRLELPGIIPTGGQMGVEDGQRNRTSRTVALRSS
jgi:hypothetical protein